MHERPHADSFSDTVMKRFKENGWRVVDQYIGKAPEHSERYQDFIPMFENEGDMAMRFNEAEAPFLLKSRQQAGAITAGKKTKKDKSKEKNLNYPAEEQTDYSEAADTLIWGVLKLNMYTESTAATGGGIYTPQ